MAIYSKENSVRAKIGDYAFAMDGVAVAPVQRGNRCYVTVENIAEDKLGDMHTF